VDELLRENDPLLRQIEQNHKLATDDSLLENVEKIRSVNANLTKIRDLYLQIRSLEGK